MKTSKLEDFKRFIWNRQTRTCLGRTRESWFKIIAFYICLYSCLAAIWALYFKIFHLTISDKYPKWQLGDSLIGTSPGLGIRPQSPRHRVESALISYREGKDGTYEHWVNDLNQYLESFDTTRDLYRNNKNAKINCDRKMDSEDSESFCPFDNSSIPAQCTSAQNYSFSSGRPCLLIKLNRIYGWKPEPYRSRPKNFPRDSEFTPGNIHITCHGQQDVDKEHIGPIAYYPAQGIDTKYYPFLNQPGYQSPYVMVHFKNPKLDTLIYVECRAWVKNIEIDSYNRKGTLSFELFIEKSPTASLRNEEVKSGGIFSFLNQ